jgi:hypothetical protein
MRQEGRMGIKDLGGRRLLHLRKERTNTNGIGEWSSGQRSPLGSEGTLKKTLCEIVRGKITKQVVGISSGLQRMVDWTLWRGWPPP